MPLLAPAEAGKSPSVAHQPRLPLSRPAAGTERDRPQPRTRAAVVHQPQLPLSPAAGRVPVPPVEAAGDSGQSQLPMSLRAPAPPVAAGLLAQARRGLADAERETDPVERFVGAYLAALRGAAAVLAARGRPHRGRSRPASTWVLLDSVAPELREWSAFFAGNSATRAAAQAGITGKVTGESAAELVRAAVPFLELVRRLVHGLPITGEAHVA
ncbi:SAV_6107 family HEPN domain-containing protein [Amycolatopsis sp. OK19-0408]|uniref:SAV_6107 family HEPN domain-containing protein n=1 Tax=Amycolatopsis iheyensis TaxID=2945988 RepID=A0A9X2SNM1_9PSEU|nr:SAV_6107 family HEPN domain-containing protein [Amycolatopsis iheyensis]MCR6488123.1 SAV_6107 family HEPN domain-containing protein [Amycolatopsis iheyensis]